MRSSSLGNRVPIQAAAWRVRLAEQDLDDSPEFAAWFAARLRREGLTMEAAARRLDVSAKTISRWVAGSTEPRLRDLLRIRETFGEPPIH